MSWQFERVAGPFQGEANGVVWADGALLVSLKDEGRILGYDTKTRTTTEQRRYTNRVNGIARGPKGQLYGAQEGGRRLVEMHPDGRMTQVHARIAQCVAGQPILRVSVPRDDLRHDLRDHHPGIRRERSERRLQREAESQSTDQHPRCRLVPKRSAHELSQRVLRIVPPRGHEIRAVHTNAIGTIMPIQREDGAVRRSRGFKAFELLHGRKARGEWDSVPARTSWLAGRTSEPILFRHGTGTESTGKRDDSRFETYPPYLR